MAYNDSGELPVSQSTYSLGGYTFELKVQTVHEPGEEDVVSVFAVCHSPDGERETVPMDFPAGTTVESWSVEANETEATVYAKIESDPLVDGNIPTSNTIVYISNVSTQHHWIYTGALFSVMDTENGYATGIAASSSSGTHWYLDYDDGRGPQDQGVLDGTFTYQGKTVYYRVVATAFAANRVISPEMFTRDVTNSVAHAAWHMIYEQSSQDGEQIIARFAIDLREADGGPDGPWDEPGDVGPDPEKHFTLTVSVTGASAGSNNGTPLEAGQAGGYGDGGTGGNGGGGGAGASTVIIYEFATNKADNVVQEATAQGPGTGGPGGKGGKGGDGCILIFY